MPGERRARWLAPCAALLVAAAAHAGTSHHHAHAHPAHEAPPPPPPPDVRAELRDQLAAERASIDQATEAVSAKLAAADAARVHRLAAAARALAASPSDADDADRRMAAARRIAAARFLCSRDASERGLLADELAHLEAARVRTDAAAQLVATITLPVALGWPAAGTIVHHAGLFEQQRAHAELSRRGIEIAVDEHAAVVAPAAGVVRYAGPIRGLDHCVILDHGDYETVLARLGEVAVPTGAHVAAGDRLGHAVEDRVYFEVRVKLGPGGLPIDPEPLLR